MGRAVVVLIVIVLRSYGGLMQHPARLPIGLICQCQFHLLSPVPVEKAGEQPLASGDSVAETVKLSGCQSIDGIIASLQCIKSISYTDALEEEERGWRGAVDAMPTRAARPHGFLYDSKRRTTTEVSLPLS